MIPPIDKMFDDLVKALRDLAEPRVVIALLVDREGGVHFTAQGDRDFIEETPAILLQMADTLVEDIKQAKALDKH
jgi:hypothetical protein